MHIRPTEGLIIQLVETFNFAKLSDQHSRCKGKSCSFAPTLKVLEAELALKETLCIVIGGNRDDSNDATKKMYVANPSSSRRLTNRLFPLCEANLMLWPTSPRIWRY